MKSVIRNEASGQVLGVQYVRKGQDYREYVLSLLKCSLIGYSVLLLLHSLPMDAFLISGRNS